MAPENKQAKASAAEEPVCERPKKRSRKATSTKMCDQDGQPTKSDEPVEKIDGLRVYSPEKVQALADKHAQTAILRLREYHSVKTLPGELKLQVRKIDDSKEAIYADTQVQCEWTYTYNGDDKKPPSGRAR